MNDRAFRLDFFIAVAAVPVSALTAGTLIYQRPRCEAAYPINSRNSALNASGLSALAT